MKTLLTKKIIRKIKTSVINGQNNQEIAKSLGISENTLKDWCYRNTHKIAKDIRMWKIEKMIRDAERVSNEILSTDYFISKNKINPKLLVVMQKEAQFLREKLIIAQSVYNKNKIPDAGVCKPLPILHSLFID